MTAASPARARLPEPGTTGRQAPGGHRSADHHPRDHHRRGRGRRRHTGSPASADHGCDPFPDPGRPRLWPVVPGLPRRARTGAVPAPSSRPATRRAHGRQCLWLAFTRADRVCRCARGSSCAGRERRQRPARDPARRPQRWPPAPATTTSSRATKPSRFWPLAPGSGSVCSRRAGRSAEAGQLPGGARRYTAPASSSVT